MKKRFLMLFIPILLVGFSFLFFSYWKNKSDPIPVNTPNKDSPTVLKTAKFNSSYSVEEYTFKGYKNNEVQVSSVTGDDVYVLKDKFLMYCVDPSRTKEDISRLLYKDTISPEGTKLLKANLNIPIATKINLLSNYAPSNALVIARSVYSIDIDNVFYDAIFIFSKEPSKCFGF